MKRAGLKLFRLQDVCLTYEEIAEFSDLTIEEVKTLDEKQPA